MATAGNNAQDIINFFKGRQDPHLACNFIVEIDGVFSGRFQEVSGLGGSVALKEIKEGGLNNYTHKFVDRSAFGDITLKRGFWSNPFLFDWFYMCANGTRTERKNGTIIMATGPGLFEQVARWDFFRAIPIKWDGPAMSAKGSDIAVESVTLAVETIYLSV